MIKLMSSSSTIAIPTEKFLEEVQKRPCLWDPTDPKFKNASAKKMAFHLIAAHLSPDAPHKDEIGFLLSQKWRGISEHYINVIQGDATKLEKYGQNPLIKRLAFLDSTFSYHKASKTRPPCSSERIKARPPGSSVTHSDRVSPRSSNPPVTCSTATSTERNDAVLSQSTFIIDGVEFVQVTLANGESIVKLKDEVLDPPVPTSPGEKPTTNTSKNKLLPVRSPRQKEQHSQTKRFGGHDLKLKQEPLDDIQPRKTELKIASTTTLASTGSKSSHSNQLKINGTSNLCSTAGSIRMSDENSSPNVGSTTSNAATGVDQTDLEKLKDRQKKSSGPSKSASGKLRDTAKRRTASKELGTNKMEFVEISDEEVDGSGLVKQAPPSSAAGASPVFLHTEANRLGSVHSKPRQLGVHIDGSEEDPLAGTASNDSWSSDAKSSSHSLTSNKRVRTNRNSLVTQVYPACSPAQTPSPMVTPTKSIKTNRNTDVLKGGSVVTPPNASPDLTPLHPADFQFTSTYRFIRSLSPDARKPSPNVAPSETVETSHKAGKTSSDFGRTSVQSQAPVKISDDGRHISPILTPTQTTKGSRNQVVRITSSDPDDLNGSSHLPVKRLRTNRDPDVSKTTHVISSSAGGSWASDDAQNPSPNRTPTKTRANLSRAKKAISSPENSLHSQPSTPGKTLRTNRNTVISSTESSDSSSDDDETPPRSPFKIYITDPSPIVKKKPKFTRQPSKLKPTARPANPIESPDEDEEKSENSDSPNTPEVDDDDKNFLLNLLPEMKTMTDPQNYAFRLDIMQALQRAKYS